jgi:hypothetical protein
MSRFLNTLTTHYRDTNQTVGTGFILLALHTNPTLLKDLVRGSASKQNLAEALTSTSFPRSSCSLVCLYPEKFLYLGLLTFLKAKTPELVDLLTMVLAKVDITSDPAPHMQSLEDALSSRLLIGDKLKSVAQIKLSLPRLITILHRLSPLSSDTIHECFDQDSSKWEAFSLQSSNLEESKDARLSLAEVEQFYQHQTSMLRDVIPLSDMITLSNSVSDVHEEYRHNNLQAAIAGICIAQPENFIIAASPTGSGKTWIQGLIAKHFALKGERVTVVEPN